MSRSGYIEKQSEEDREWIRDLEASFEDMHRRRFGERPPKPRRELYRNLAIDIHKTSTANTYFADRGLTERTNVVVDGEGFTTEEINRWAGELRRLDESLTRRMDRLGLLDPPEDRTAGPQPGDVFASEHVEISFVGGGEESDELEDDVDDE